MEKLVIGIDFSKETMNYCCMCGSANTVVLEGVVANSQDGCKEMIRGLRDLYHGLKVCDFLFCGENTGCYSIEVAEYLFSKKYVIWLESPLQIKMSSGVRREKTDAADARMIAEYAFRHQDKAKAYNPQSKSVAKLKIWLKAHNALTEVKTSLRNLMQSMQVIPCTLEKAWETVIIQLKATDKKIREILKQEDELSVNASLAMSVPGISYISTAAILIDTRNFTRFTDPRKYANHVGCVPHKHDSGTTIHHKPHVSKASNRYINSLLTEGAVSLMTHNQHIKEYVLMKRKEGKNNGCIINNIRNKTIHRLFAVIRERKAFDRDYRGGMQKKNVSKLCKVDTSLEKFSQFK